MAARQKIKLVIPNTKLEPFDMLVYEKSYIIEGITLFPVKHGDDNFEEKLCQLIQHIAQVSYQKGQQDLQNDLRKLLALPKV